MIKIDSEFAALIPPLTQEEYNLLEKSIVAEGCREALIVWNDTLIDGHNRYEICQKHNLPFKTHNKDFASRNEVLIWIINNQLGRRNLAPFQRAELALKFEPLIREKAKENQGTRIDILQISAESKIIKPLDTRKEISKLANVSHDTLHKAKVIIEHGTEEQKQKLRLNESTINQEYLKVKRELKRNEVRKMEPQPLPTGKYRVIYSDPPWSYDFAETTNREIENQYQTMTLEDIKALKIPSDDNAVLFLWATAPKLREALEVMSAWGFEYRTSAVWDKEKIGMGYWFRGQHEYLLVGTKGTYPSPLPENRHSSVIRCERNKHSEKPSIVYEMIERMCPETQYLELFARTERERWVQWGNEVLIKKSLLVEEVSNGL